MSHRDDQAAGDGIIRRAGRTVSWPFRGVMSAPRAHLVDNEAIWSLREWQDIAQTLRPGSATLDGEDLSERERRWIDPRQWPTEVVNFVLMNIQCAAVLFLALSVLCVLAIVRAGADESMTDFARLSFLVGGCCGLLITIVLYVGAALDFVRLSTLRLQMPVRALAREPMRWWIFHGDHGLRSFLRSLGGHLLISWRMRGGDPAHLKVVVAVFQRAVVVLALIVVPLLFVRLVTLVL